MVRRIFELYATNQYSMKEIEEIIFKRLSNNNGNRLSHTTMSNIITNPKYKGYFVGGKVKLSTFSTSVRNFSQRMNGSCIRRTERYCPASGEELWQAANEVFKRRSIDVKGLAQLLHTQEHLYRKTVLH